MSVSDSAEPISAIPEPETGKAGRPSKYEPETVDRLLAALADDLNIKQSCLAAGIGEATLGSWRDEHAELEAQLTQARETARRKVLAMIKSIGDETQDWRALDTWLQRSFPADYRWDSGINVKAEATVQQANVILTDEGRAQLQEKLKRIQALRAKSEQAALAEPKPAETEPKPESPEPPQSPQKRDLTQLRALMAKQAFEQETWQHPEPWD